MFVALKISCLLPLIKQPAILGMIRAGQFFENTLRRILGLIVTPDVHNTMLEYMDRDPLMLACESRAKHIIRAIAQDGIGLEPGIHSGQVLFKAFVHRDVPLVEELLAAGSDLSLSDYMGGNFLHWAVMAGWNTESLQRVCELAQNCDLIEMAATLCEGSKPFDLAVLQGRLQVANFLLRFTLDEDPAHIDVTPSHLREILGPLLMTLLGAALWKLDAGTIKTRIVRYILAMDPDFIVCPDNGMTALHSAVISPWVDQKRNCKFPTLQFKDVL
jgi:ankyrin repeat protein